MVFSGGAVAAVANVSADLCQYIACNPERLDNDQILHLLFCFPFQQLRRFAFCIWTFFCFPYPDSPYPTTSSSSSSLSYDFDLQEEDLHSD